MRIEQAARLFEMSLEVEKDSAFALRGYAEILRLLGRYEEALVKFQESLALEPQNAFALRGFADTLRQQGKFKNAALKYEEVLAISPKDKFALKGYAEILKMQDKAIYDRILAQRREESVGVVREEVIAIVPGKQNRDVPHAAKCKPPHEVNKPQEEEEANSINCYVEMLESQGKLRDSAHKLQQRLTKEPENTKILIDYAVFLLMDRKFEEAELKLKAALTLEPKCNFFKYLCGNFASARKTG